MALKAGRVGVNPSQVDMAGNVIGGGGNTYTKLEIDQMLGSKVGIGQLEANNKDFYFAYDETSQKYGYKLDGTGDFHPFEEAGGSPGWNKPANLTDDNLNYGTSFTKVEGGYFIDGSTVYVDITVLVNSRTNFEGFPPCRSTSSGRFLVVMGDTAADVKDSNIGNTDGVYMFAGKGNLNLQNVSSANKYYHIFGAYIKE